ncbi:MAG: arsenite methyltransferase [Fimbriimonadaceae bacterium]
MLRVRSPDHLRDEVRRRYGQIAASEGTGCCGPSCCDPVSSGLYGDEVSDVPQSARAVSLGCANPHTAAGLQTGEHVLDLGSGAGLDALVSARAVGPHGLVYGLDMTDEMLALAERNRAEADAQNVRFLKGYIEEVPLPADSVDVVISNCVINLSGDKARVLSEAFRVLRPGGRLAVADVVTEGPLPEAIGRDLLAAVGCVAGALERDEYLRLLAEAGFEDPTVEPFRRYRLEHVQGLVSPEAFEQLAPAEREGLEGRVMGAVVRATKPGTART